MDKLRFKSFTTFPINYCCLTALQYYTSVYLKNTNEWSVKPALLTVFRKNTWTNPHISDTHFALALNSTTDLQQELLSLWCPAGSNALKRGILPSIDLLISQPGEMWCLIWRDRERKRSTVKSKDSITFQIFTLAVKACLHKGYFIFQLFLPLSLLILDQMSRFLFFN